MVPGGRHVKFTPKFVRPNWFPRGCLVRPFMSEAGGSGKANIGTRAGADTASMAAAEKSLGIVTPKPIGCAKSKYFQTHLHGRSCGAVPFGNVENGILAESESVAGLIWIGNLSYTRTLAGALVSRRGRSFTDGSIGRLGRQRSCGDEEIDFAGRHPHRSRARTWCRVGRTLRGGRRV